MINKNISVWRGDQNPPTEYHLWLNSEGKLLAKINEQWEQISGDDIPLASDTVDGLLTASDFTSLKDNTTKIQSIWEGNPVLVTPTISGTWTITNQNNTQIATSTNANITYEKGYKAKFEGTWKWASASRKKDPSRTDGAWGTTLPTSNTNSTKYTSSNITSTTTFTQNIYADKLGLMVSGSNVTPASGEDKTSASVSVTFLNRMYYGVATSQTPTESIVTSLSNTGLVNSRVKTISNITATSSQYYYYAYPTSLGALTKITQDGSTPVIGAFTRNILTITNDAGLSVELFVYVSNNPGAFTNNELKFE